LDTQTVMNMSWPLGNADQGWHARGIPDRPGIPVEVRIVWSRDGEEWHSGRATRWTERHVYVPICDDRLVGPGVWVLATDVRRDDLPKPDHGIPAT